MAALVTPFPSTLHVISMQLRDSRVLPNFGSSSNPESSTWRCGSILLRPRESRSADLLHQGTYLYHIGTSSHSSATVELLVSFPVKKASN